MIRHSCVSSVVNSDTVELPGVCRMAGPRRIVAKEHLLKILEYYMCVTSAQSFGVCILLQPCDMIVIRDSIAMLQMKKIRLRDMKLLAQPHTVPCHPESFF